MEEDEENIEEVGEEGLEGGRLKESEKVELELELELDGGVAVGWEEGEVG